MGFLTDLKNEAKNLNHSVNNVTNCEKAKKLRKKLICIGMPIAILGFLGAFVCFILFATAGMDAFTPNGFSARIIVPFVLLIPCFVIGGIGAAIAGIGFSITVTGYTTQFIDKYNDNVCPNCGDAIDADELFCNKCGTKVKLQCSKCNAINPVSSDYCKNCGERLQK